ncbi:serine protein kinase RIO [Thermococcus sp.]
MRGDWVEREIERMMGLRERRRKDSELYKVVNEVFDRTTIEGLAFLHRRGKISELQGVVSTGKEANVFTGFDSRGSRVAVKVYRTYTTEFRRMWEYLAADPRMGYLPKDVRKLVFQWTRREFKNLQRAIKHGIRAPKPLAFRNNVLVMEFIGDEGPAPRLKDAEGGLSKAELERLYSHLIEVVERLWREGEMVHGDLSEYNVLLWNEPVVIDWSQATVRRNRMSVELLKRDLRNIIGYFARKGINVDDYDEKLRELLEV